MQEWVTEMSQYMKAIDPYHMVTIGEEVRRELAPLSSSA